MKNSNKNSAPSFGRLPTTCAAICQPTNLCTSRWALSFISTFLKKIENYADRALEDDEITFKQLWQSGEEDALELQEEVKKQCLENIGYFVEPQYLFTSIIDAIKRKENIIPSLERSLKRIEDSTLG